MLAGQAEILFESSTGTITVTGSADGVNLALEMDMLEPTEQPPPNLQGQIRQELDPCSETPWDRQSIDPLLSSLVNALDSQGQYLPVLERLDEVPSHPKIAFAPAIILRPRTRRGLVRCYENIVNQLRNDATVPFCIRKVCEIVDDNGKCDAFPDASSDSDQNETGEVYFPLPANDEQRQIVERLTKRRGILVQGPPGTGKSHTIANLICHLLATGKRILVTSQTPRALKVLNHLLPEDVRPLCVSVLGEDRQAMQNLQDVVAKINDRFHEWDASKNAAHIKRLHARVLEARAKIAQLQNARRELRQADTLKYDLPSGYTGTPATIAKQLASEQDVLSWIPDTISPEQPLPLSSDTLLRLRLAYQQINDARSNELELKRLSFESLPTPEEFHSLGKALQYAQTASTKYAKAIPPHSIKKALTASPEQRRAAHQNLESLQLAISAAKNRQVPWMSKAINEVLMGHESPWSQLRQITQQEIDQLHPLIAKVESCDIILPDDANTSTMEADAEELLAHLKKGHGFGWWVFAAPIVKRTRQLRASVRVNNRPCSTPEALEKLIAYLGARRLLKNAAATWSSLDPFSPDGPLPVITAEVEERVEALDLVLCLYGLRRRAQQSVAPLGIEPESWHIPTSVSSTIQRLDAAEAYCAYRIAKDTLDNLQQKLRDHSEQPDSHLSSSRGVIAVESRDQSAWQAFLAELKQQDDDSQLLEQRGQWHEALSDCAPEFADDLSKTAPDAVWDRRLSQADAAWHWAQSDTWLKDYHKQHDPVEIERNLLHQEKSLADSTAQLASEEAWRHCFERMTGKQRTHLMAWASAIKRVGRGTGKWAPKNRRDAAANLQECRDAIPAWVMPFYRVVDSGLCHPNSFDVVIIDEASQSGPESLLLFYIGKQCIVVGDDQQISPAAVGVDQEQTNLLAERYLNQIPAADSLGPQSSLFEQGEIRFGSRIVLREHFRCMPEIIRFSNDLSYAATPLRCLRQYPPNRLSPLRCVYVPNGYREGDNQRAVNRPEAEAIVNQILLCCANPDYAGKSMGVISLQSQGQADLIQHLLLEQLPPEEVEKRRIVCGDAYAFQGDERDIIFLSMVAAPNRPIGRLTKGADKQRFNVAASRSRDQMWLFHSVTLADLGNSDCMRHKLLNYMLNPYSALAPTFDDMELQQLRLLSLETSHDTTPPPSPFDSWFEVYVFLKIVDHGYRVIPQYKVSSYRIDLVVEGFQAQLAIECDGDEYHTLENYEGDMARQRVLEDAVGLFGVYDLVNSIAILTNPLSHSGRCSGA